MYVECETSRKKHAKNIVIHWQTNQNFDNRTLETKQKRVDESVCVFAGKQIIINNTKMIYILKPTIFIQKLNKNQYEYYFQRRRNEISDEEKTSRIKHMDNITMAEETMFNAYICRKCSRNEACLGVTNDTLWRIVPNFALVSDTVHAPLCCRWLDLTGGTCISFGQKLSIQFLIFVNFCQKW